MASNNKWYVLIDVNAREAVDYLQLPEIWMDMGNMWSLSDEQLANMYTWSEYRNYSFISLDQARTMNIGERGLTRCINKAKPQILAQLRAMRDLLLSSTDIATVGDKWSAYDSVSQTKITKYRQSLRNLTEGDITNVVWPAIPSELDFIRKINISSIDRPSDEFVTSLTTYQPEPIAKIKAEVAQRIMNERDRRKADGIKVDLNGISYWFWTDDTSRAQYSLLDGIARRNNWPDAVVLSEWKTMSGVFVKMTVGLLHTIIAAGMQQELQIFNIAELHKMTMMASSDPTSYNYSTGWPMSYSDFIRTINS